MQHRVGFRVDASAGMGGGHVYRCLSLADELAARGWHATFFCRDGATATVPELGSSAHAVVTVSGSETEVAGQIAESVANFTAVVVDHYGLDARFERVVGHAGGKMVVIDDLADRPHHCDLLIDQNLGATAARYDGRLNAGARVLAGLDYALLRPEFSRARAVAESRRACASGPGRVFISAGKTDPSNVTSTLLAGAGASRAQAIDVVIGSACPHLPAIERRVARMGERASLHIDTRRVAELMARSDIALGAGGTSSWERCCLGLPTLLVTVAANQLHAAQALQDAGCAVMLGDHASLRAEAVTDEIDALLDDPQRLAALSARSGALVDGRGVTRVADAIERPE